jgi:hypothetical protein
MICFAPDVSTSIQDILYNPRLVLSGKYDLIHKSALEMSGRRTRPIALYVQHVSRTWRGSTSKSRSFCRISSHCAWPAPINRMEDASTILPFISTRELIS